MNQQQKERLEQTLKAVLHHGSEDFGDEGMAKCLLDIAYEYAADQNLQQAISVLQHIDQDYLFLVKEHGDTQFLADLLDNALLYEATVQVAKVLSKSGLFPEDEPKPTQSEVEDVQ